MLTQFKNFFAGQRSTTASDDESAALHGLRTIDAINDEIATPLIEEFIAAGSRLSLITQADLEAARRLTNSRLYSIVTEMRGRYETASRQANAEYVRSQRMDVSSFIRSMVELNRGSKG